MSILQNVERCIANQQTYKALNAFVALNIDVHAFQRAAISADDRLSRGPFSIYMLNDYSNISQVKESLLLMAV